MHSKLYMIISWIIIGLGIIGSIIVFISSENAVSFLFSAIGTFLFASIYAGIGHILSYLEDFDSERKQQVKQEVNNNSNFQEVNTDKLNVK